jgi:hypothetical protein
VLVDVLLHGALPAHGFEAARDDDHRLGLPTQEWRHVAATVFSVHLR